MKTQGTYQNPISLEDEEEQEKNITEDMLQKARNQAILDQAMITGSRFDICIAVVKTTITGSIQVKTRRVNKQIINYFYKTVKIKIHSDHFNKRIEPDYSDSSTSPNPCVFILYGVDFLSNQMIIDRFRGLGTRLKQINWIDDSTCKLIYPSAEQAQKVLKSQIKDQLPLKIEEENDNEISRQWFVLKPYCIYSFQRPLLMRYATNKEANLEKNKLNRFQQFERAEEGLYHHLLTTFHASEQYQRIMEKIQNQRIFQRSRRRSIEPRCRSRNDRNRCYNNSQADLQANQHKRYGNDEGKFGNRNYKRYEDGRPRSTFVKQIRKTKYEHRPVDMNQLSFQQINYVAGDNNRNRKSSADNNKNSVEFSRVYYDYQEQPSMNLSFDILKDLNGGLQRGSFKKNNTSDDNLQLSYVKNIKNIEKEHSKDSINLNLTLKSNNQQNHNKSINIDTSFNIAPKQQSKSKEDSNLSFKYKTFDNKEYDKQSEDHDLSHIFDIDEEISPVQDHMNCSFKLKEKEQKQLNLQLSKQNDASFHLVPTKGKKGVEQIQIDSDSGY